MNDYGRSPERSIVTLLAFDTVRSTVQIAGLDPDDAQVFLDRILGYIRTKVESLSGLVASFHGDGGFAVFGWPNSLEDHADIACEAAWAIQHPPKQNEIPKAANGQPVRFRIGIHTGLVGFRRLETGAGSSLDLVGINVHLAAALQKAAPANGIVISNHTRTLCKNMLSLEPFETTGDQFTDHAPYFELRGPPAQTAHRSIVRSYPFPIVGREVERRRIKAALTPAPGRPSSAAIIGEPGIGKSRLAMSIVADWEKAGRTVLSFSGNARRQATPFAMMRSLILAAINVGEEEDENKISAALSNAGIPQTHVAELGKSIFRLNDGSVSDVIVQTTRQVARRLVETLSALTADIRPHLIIEDVHLIDPESLECLSMITSEQECGHIVTMMTGRPEARETLNEFARVTVLLEPMSRDEMRVMAAKLCGDGIFGQELIDRMLQQADGVPFILEQLIAYAEDAKAQPDIQLPQSVESLIHGRLNKLSRQVKSMVQTLSVIGTEVELEIASSLTNTDAKTLLAQAGELERLGLLRYEAGNLLRFTHSIVAAGCLNTVPKQKRKAIHQAAVAAIMSVYPQPDSQYERLAFHAEGAGDGDMALDYLWLAGAQARRSAAFASLTSIFRRAMQCIETYAVKSSGRYVDFVLLACPSMLQIGEFKEMRKAVPRALEIARSMENPDKICGVLCQLAMLQWFEGRNKEAKFTCEEAVALAEKLNWPPLIFASRLALANVLHGLGRVRDAIAMQEDLCIRLSDELASARLGSPAVPSSVANSFLSWFKVETGQYAEALADAEKSLRIAIGHRDSYAEVLARNAQGRVLLQQNRNSDAMRTLLAAKRICDSEGFDAINPHVTGRLAAAMARAGNIAMALKTAEQQVARTNGERTGYLEMFNLRLGYGEALFRSGQFEQGMGEIDAALAMADKINSPCLRVQGLGVRICLARMADSDRQLIASDTAELKRLCDGHGLVAWEP